MDTQVIQKNIRILKGRIEQCEQSLSLLRDELAHAETQLADAIAAESKEPELENGDYGKLRTKWVVVDGKVHWEDGIVSELSDMDFIKYRRGNFIREMEEREE